MRNTLFAVFVMVLGHYLSFSQIPELLPRFPVMYDSQTNYPRFGGAESLPIVADFKGDGQKEIAIGSSCYNYCNPKMFLIDFDGNIPYGWPKTFFTAGTGRYIWATAAGDLLGNGKIDLIVKTSDSIYAVDYLGNNLPGFPVPFTGIYGDQTPFSLCLYDLDNSGTLNIIAAANNKIAVFNNDGTYKTGWPATIGSSQEFRGNITCGDIVGDRKGQIIVAAGCIGTTCDSNFIYAFDRNGNSLPGWPVHSDSLYNFNWDAGVVLQPDTVNPANSILYYCSSFYDTGAYVRTRINICNTQGNIIRRWYFYDIVGNLGVPLVADISNNGNLELFTGEQAAYGYLYSIDGSLIPGWPELGQDEYARQSCIAKVTFANVLSIMTIDPQGLELHAYSFTGIDRQNWPLLPNQNYTIEGIAFAGINSGDSAIMLAAGNGIWQSSGAAKLFAYTIPSIPFTKENFPWPMFGHDRYRTNQLGFVPPDEPIGIKRISHNIPGKFALYQNYPNPFNPSTTIKFAVPLKSHVILQIYDVAGREVKHTDFAELQSGEYSIEWDAVNNASGVYIYRIEATSALHNYADVKKMVLLK